MNDKTDWEELIERHLRGELSESEQEDLVTLLDGHASVRKQVVEYVQWDTEISEALRERKHLIEDTGSILPAQSALHGGGGKATVRKMMPVAVAVVIAVLLVGVIFPRTDTMLWQNDQEDRDQQALSSKLSVAKITGLSGALMWTGDRGQIIRDINVGTELAGGTIEGLAPDAWFELQFKDGSTITLSGASLLTFADMGQKKVRLREGRFSANIKLQPVGKPMLIYTRSAVLKVLGTQFDVEADLASTVLTVSKGEVNLRRFSDDSEVNVSSEYRVTTDTDGAMMPVRIPGSVHSWKSHLHVKQTNYGKWRPARSQQAASLKAIPLIPPKNPESKLYLAGFSLERGDSPPVILLPGSTVVVRGRLASQARVHFGIRVMYPNGEFAGMFRGDLSEKQPLSVHDDSGLFEEVYSLQNFTIDPVVRDQKSELATRPDNLILDGVWAFTNTGGPSGLEIIEVEVIPPQVQESKQ